MGNRLPAVLEYYRAFSRNILDDIPLIEDDVEFLEGGGRIYYAIDFSEIYAYANGAADTFFATRSLGTLEDAPLRAELIELHEAILQFVLFDAQPQVLVLEPYWVELCNYVYGLRSGIIIDKSRTIARAIAQQEAAPTKADYEEFIARLSVVGEMGGARDNNRERLGELLLRLAPAIVDLWQETLEESALKRLVGLLEKKRVVFPRELFDLEETSEPDGERFDAWYAKLSKRRRDRQGQNFIDAEAVGLLYSINSRLLQQTPPVMIKLVTRSKTMASIMRHEANHGVWDKAGRDIIRHPRGFLTWVADTYDINMAGTASERRRSVSRWKRSFEKIAGTDSDPARSKGALTETEVLKRQVAYLSDFWKKYCGVNLARYESISQLPGEDNASLARALVAARDKGVLYEAISSVLARLQDRLDKVHFILRNTLSNKVVMAARLAEDVHMRTAVIVPVGHAIMPEEMKVRLFSPHGVPLPFSVYIENHRLRAEMRDYCRAPHRVLEGVVNDPLLPDKETQDGNPSDQEWYLALSYAHAAIGTWGMALRSAEFAREQEQTQGGGRSGAYLETLYLIAKARRHLDRGVEELGAIGQELFRASGINNLSPEWLTSYNVRFLSEYFKVRCVILRKMYDEGVTDSDPAAAAAVEVVTSIADKVKRHAEHLGIDAEYLDLLNNICFHFAQFDVMGRPILEPDSIVCLLSKLEENGAMVFGAIDAWPDNYVDTLCWVRCMLIGKGYIPNLSKVEFENSVLKPLDVLSCREFVSDVDKKEFMQHRSEAHSYWAEHFATA